MRQDYAQPTNSPTGPVDAEALRKCLDWDRKEMAAFLDLSSRAYASRVRTGRFDLGTRLKIEMLAVVFEEAKRVLRSDEEASGWLRYPVISLSRRPPIEHLDSIQGYETVRNTLAKIEYGMY